MNSLKRSVQLCAVLNRNCSVQWRPMSSFIKDMIEVLDTRKST